MARYLEFRLSLLFFLEGKHPVLQRENAECSNCTLGLGRSFPRQRHACFQIHWPPNRATSTVCSKAALSLTTARQAAPVW